MRRSNKHKKKDLCQESDEVLMALYQEDLEDAFSILYQRYAGKVFGYLRKNLQDQQAAADVSQMVFIKLHRCRSRYHADLLFAPWLFTIARNSMLDWKKSQNTQNRYFRAIDRQDEDSLANIETDIIDENIDHLGLGRLPQSQREAVEMRYLEDMSFDDIARRLGTTSINARQLVNRGLKKIRKFFLSKERKV